MLPLKILLPLSEEGIPLKYISEQGQVIWGTIPTSLIGGWLVRYPSKCLEGRAKGRHSFDQVSQAKVLQEKGDGSGPAWVLRLWQEAPNQRGCKAGRKQI